MELWDYTHLSAGRATCLRIGCTGAVPIMHEDDIQHGCGSAVESLRDVSCKDRQGQGDRA